MGLGLVLVTVMSVFCWPYVYINHETSSGPCVVQENQTGDIEVDCGNKGLASVPRELPTNTKRLDLSLNEIHTLHSFDFSHLRLLLVLNISGSNIQVIQKKAFEGLDTLQKLYIAGNPVLTNVTTDVFQGLSNLKILSAWNRHQTSFPLPPLSNLTNLKELIINPGRIPQEVAAFQELEVLKLVHLGLKTLRKVEMQPLSRMKIREISFLKGHINFIENNTFDNFSYLKVLNFACNKELPIDNVIDALSSSRGVAVETLILDVTNQNITDYWPLGTKDFPVCRKAWKDIKHLTARGTYIEHLQVNTFLKCLPNMESLAIGFNALYIFKFPKEILKAVNFKSFDFSFGETIYDLPVQRTLGCNGDKAMWIPKTEDIVPPVLLGSCILPNQSSISANEEGCQSVRVQLPPCLSYINANHLNIPQMPGVYCLSIENSNLRYLNLAYVTTQFKTQIQSIYSKSNVLEFIDISGFGLSILPKHLHLKLPFLKRLRAANNFLESLDTILDVPSLEIFDLSDNRLSNLEAIFVHVKGLRELYLQNNRLKSLEFLSGNLENLNVLDIAGNRLDRLDHTATNVLESIYTQNKNLTLNIINNTFQCDCQGLHFVEWFHKTEIDVQHREGMHCSFSGQRTRIQAINVKSLRINCFFSEHVIVIVTSSVGFVFVTVVSLFVCYKKRWTIRWWYYTTRLRWLEHQRGSDGLLSESMDEEPNSKTYVVFPEDDDNIRSWVFNELLVKIEIEYDVPNKLFLNGRNDMLGYHQVENMTNGLMSSESALWIVCPSFFEDKMCEHAAHFAFHHLGRKRNLIIIMEERMEQYKVPKEFYSLMNKKTGIRKITYTAEPTNQRQLFWGILQKFVCDRRLCN